MKIAQPLKYANGNPVCPVCREVITPSLEFGSMDRYIVHVTAHTGDEARARKQRQDTVERLRKDLRNRITWQAARRGEIKAAQRLLDRDRRKAAELRIQIALVTLVPIKTPKLREIITGLPRNTWAARGPSISMRQIRALARRLGLKATPKTNPIRWFMPTEPATNKGQET